MAEKRHKRRMKGTLFSKCSDSHELFNTNRMAKMKIKQVLGRVGYLMLRDGSMMINGEKNRPDLANDDTVKVLRDMESAIEGDPKFLKPDYFASAPFIEGLMSANEFAKRGMQVHCLQSKLIYAQYGVYMPTSQEYLNLFANYVEQMADEYEQKKSLVDLGCGSGILPIILKQKGRFLDGTERKVIVGLDQTEAALECSKLNMQLFGMMTSRSHETYAGESMQAQANLELILRNADIVDLWGPAGGLIDDVIRVKQ